MATREYRLSEFELGTPVAGATVELLCEDTRGTFALPFPCQWRDDAWCNADTGAVIEVSVLGWRAWL